MTRVLSGQQKDWEQIGPHLAQRVLVEVPGTRLMIHRLDAGFHNPLHEHAAAQLDVVVSGRGVHSWVEGSVRGGRVVQRTRATPVGAGDCYYIPPHLPHEFGVDPARPLVLLEVMMTERDPGALSAFVARPAPAKGQSWSRADAVGGRRLVVARTPEAEFAYYELPVGYHGTPHSHPALQAGVCLSGALEHEMVLSVRRGRRTIRKATRVTIEAGDAYFIPKEVPHASWNTGDRPALFLDVTVHASA